jgi:predicted Rossmann fold nucleotide-binding protein DprA/Smf involved in DNA uptake
MQVGNQAQAVLLLTTHFTKPDRGEPKPLSTHEWAKFAYWLKDHDLQPSSLLADQPRRLLSGWTDHGITHDRIEYLLGRGGALGFALEKWERAGLWVLTRSDPEYPECLKVRLGLEAPPVFFGCGNKKLFHKGGIAVVGSRNASSDDLAFATQLGADAASQGFSIVSGGARGVDENAMLGALEHEGTSIGVLADSLLRSATSAKYRNYLMSNDLTLVSPFNPEVGFHVANAMARNRYIYCLADSAVVVAADCNKGGTWNGAIENLRERWVPLWVKSGANPSLGNADLVRRGAKWLPSDRSDLSLLLAPQDATPSSPEDLPLVRGEQRPTEVLQNKTGDSEAGGAVSKPETLVHDDTRSMPGAESLDEITLYDHFLHRMKSLTAEAPLDADALRGDLELTKTQLDAWLKRAVAEGRVKKTTKPVRYRWKSKEPAQTSLFGGR